MYDGRKAIRHKTQVQITRVCCTTEMIADGFSSSKNYIWVLLHGERGKKMNVYKYKHTHALDRTL